MHPVKRVIIIVGTGRCGSMLLFRLLALHPDLGWLSTFNELAPRWTFLSRFSRLYRVGELGDTIRHLPFFPKPFEAYRFWETFLPGFARRDRPLTADDVPDDAIRKVHQVLSSVLRHQDRERLLVKVTGWARMSYFDRIFPDARFIWIVRKPRAVLSSWVQAGWLDVTSSPESADWQWGPVQEEYLSLWRELGGGPLLSAALKIQRDLDNLQAEFEKFPQRAMRVWFEELIDEPQTVLREICDFAGLGRRQRLHEAVQRKTFYDPSDKWRKHLSEEEGDLILEFFRRAQSSPVSPLARERLPEKEKVTSR